MPRVGLTREAIVDAAIARADEHGLASVTMRALAGDLDVEAMSLYNHVANKRAVLEAISDRVWAATDLAVDEHDWRAALHAMCGSAHKAMSAHPWFFELPVTSFGLARVRMIEQTLRRLSEAGLRDESVYHAHHVLDGHMFGYTLQEVQFSATPEVEERGTEMLNSIDPAEFTNLMVHVQQHIDPPRGDGFTFGLDMILDGLERLVQSQQRSSDMYMYQVVSTPDGPVHRDRKQRRRGWRRLERQCWRGRHQGGHSARRRGHRCLRFRQRRARLLRGRHRGRSLRRRGAPRHRVPRAGVGGAAHDSCRRNPYVRRGGSATWHAVGQQGGWRGLRRERHRPCLCRATAWWGRAARSRVSRGAWRPRSRC